MLFFFEMFLFVLVMLTLALGEFVSRWLALILWSVVTVFTLIGYLLARQSLRGIVAGGDETSPSSAPPGASGAGLAETEPAVDAVAQPAGDIPPVADVPPTADSPVERVPPEGSVAAPREVTPLDARWARTLLYNWRRTNVLLLLGLVAVGGWYWFGG